MPRPQLRHPLVAASALVVVLAAALTLLTAGSPPRSSIERPHPGVRIHRQSPSGGPAVAAVPDVRGRSLVLAVALLRADRFRVRVVRRSDPATPPNLVLAEHPGAGTLVAPEVVIQLVVNAAPG
jgi:hypothetical protein